MVCCNMVSSVLQPECYIPFEFCNSFISYLFYPKLFDFHEIAQKLRFSQAILFNSIDNIYSGTQLSLTIV